MAWDDVDWSALERLRAAFLEGSAGVNDYWRSERDLADYDRTFAQRIGWKWDFVIEQLKQRAWSPPPGTVLDWGCGSGVASRTFLSAFGADSARRLLVWDRSPLARIFAERRARERFPGLAVHSAGTTGDQVDTLVLSHVITELTQQVFDDLLAQASLATCVLWVEPGTYGASRKLIQARERLRTSFQVIAPCPHQAICGMLRGETSSHWCHHFAAPPPEVFTDGDWVRFARMAGIDLRSLPLSYLVLDKRPISEMPGNTVRVVGRPRIYKAHALLLGCDATGINQRRVSKRLLPDHFRQLKKGEIPGLQIWECEGQEVKKTGPLLSH